jgi:tetratricopeptide repeat protein
MHRSLNRLAQLNFDQQRYAEAEVLYKRSLELAEKASEPLLVVYALNNLARVV